MSELEQQQKEQIEKLTARLQKAAEVFKTQKADIARTQAERDEANAEVDKLKAKVKEFEERINANSEAEAEMMQQAEDLTNAENEIVKLQSELNTIKTSLSETEKENIELKAKIQDAVSDIVNHMKNVAATVKELGNATDK